MTTTMRYPTEYWDHNKAPRPAYVITDAAGRRYAVDDRGRVVWETGRGAGDLMSHADALRILATYAPSTRRGLRVVEVARRQERQGARTCPDPYDD